MRGWFTEFIAWLDDHNARLDREHSYLRRSPSKIDRWLWSKIFKPKQNLLDLKGHHTTLGDVFAPKSQRIIHVVNLVPPKNLKNNDFRYRVSLALESIEKSAGNNIFLLGCSTEKITRPGWEIHKLPRSAQTELGHSKDLAYLKDLFQAAHLRAEAGDIILYSNLDCVISPDLYTNLLNADKNITEFIRRDITTQPTTSLTEVFSSSFENYPIGVDALAIKKEALEASLPFWLDFIIGEPHWDTAISGILNKHYRVFQNTEDLYHPLHEQQWDPSNLNVGGKHNERLYREAIEFGLMDDELISIKKQTALVILKHVLNSSHDKQTTQNLEQLSQLDTQYDKIFCEYLCGNKSSFSKYINHIQYLPIQATKQSKQLNQKNTILNLLRHYFADYDELLIIPEETAFQGDSQLKRLKKQLKSHKKTNVEGVIGLKPKECWLREFDFFMENTRLIPNIKQCSFINDHGLLELFDTHEHFQSPVMHKQRANK
tara:strand:+ start:1466 stop:2926 length:1461 start_codon:yes stop_codon:yes gene_type:complete